MGLLNVDESKIRYTPLPLGRAAADQYTEKMNREYDWMSRVYDLFMFIFPRWKVWIRSVLPHIVGSEILEVSFGPGYLLTRYATKSYYRVSGIDFNKRMVALAQKKMSKLGAMVELRQGKVEQLPYDDASFDTVINTMAFTGYPDGDRALAEMKRVLRHGGRLLLVDFDYPKNRNRAGYWLVRFAEKVGDIVKDIGAALDRAGFAYEDRAIGGFGSVHLFICTKKDD
ncbi:MAG: class I SAM-dependent methyltransferase [Leptospiraceae bacterium]|nr:class I SAM-dependent methyltransferase [Leptospiraceae bacterium]